MVLNRDLVIQQRFANTGTGNVETRDAVDRVDREAEAIGLILNRQPSGVLIFPCSL